MNWLINAKYIEKVCGCYQVEYEEEFYICPDCEEPIYLDDWSDERLGEELCPVCGLKKEDLE